MNYTYCKTILCLIACLLMNIASFAQDYPLVVNTLNTDGITFNKDALTVFDQTISLSYTLSDVNIDGSLLISEDQLYKIDEFNSASMSEIAMEIQAQILMIRLIESKNTIVYSTQNQELSQIHFLDMNTNSDSVVLEIEGANQFDSITQFEMSEDASSLIYGYSYGSGMVRMVQVSFDGKAYVNPQILDTREWLGFFSSKEHKKIVYMVHEKREDKAFEMEMEDGAWGEPIPLQVGDYKPNWIVFLSKDGKTLLFMGENYELQFSIYENNQWSAPVDTGYKMSTIDQILISEDGNTIAIAGARQPIPSSQSHAIPVYDLYSLMKDANGEWQLTRLNDEESAVYQGKILLTPLGNKIFWVKQPVSDITGVSQSWMY